MNTLQKFLKKTVVAAFFCLSLNTYGQNKEDKAANNDPSEELIKVLFICRTEQKKTDSLAEFYKPDETSTNKISILNLKDRTLISIPPVMTDSEVEGIVVVEIVVDEKGQVIKAKPGLRGTTTTNSILWAKARMAALHLKFSESPGTKEQIGTYSFIFTLR